eukprot:TRINITY_DN3049_c0_g1_i12.p1 TRINITY_DN3049_c0_g1~~TRINITY_DN3049_c0_g1_i12.p1  ORF type:complete len:450 (-),score=83.93 TRINITY_DN3049_c0_g1_i12:780-2129(-)
MNKVGPTTPNRQNRQNPQNPQSVEPTPPIAEQLNHAQVKAWLMYEFAEGGMNVVSIISIPKLIVSMADQADAPSSWSVWFFANFGAVFLRMLCYFTILPMADFGDLKYKMFRFFCYLGATNLLLLSFVADADLYGLAVVFFVIAKSCHGLAAVLHLSFLNQVAKDQVVYRHHVSARGVRYFAGSMSLFLVLLVLFFLLPMRLLDSDGKQWLNLRGPVAFAAVWWAGFAHFSTFANLNPTPGPPIPEDKKASMGTFIKFCIHEGFQRRLRCFKLLKKLPDLRSYMIACILFRDAASTVNTSAAIIAEDVGLNQAQLGALVIILFLSAICGTFLFASLNNNGYLTPRKIIMINLFFMLACIIFLLFVEKMPQMLLFAVVAGFNFGPLMSFIRSLFAQMIPRGFDAEFFSLFEAVVMLYSWISPLIVALIVYIQGKFSTNHLNTSFKKNDHE